VDHAMKMSVAKGIVVVSALLIVGVAIISEFVISSNINGSFSHKFDTITRGMKKEEVVGILGNPIETIAPMNSLRNFWGSKAIEENNIAPPRITLTYKARGLFPVLTGMPRPIWQIGFNEEGEAICKHQYY